MSKLLRLFFILFWLTLSVIAFIFCYAHLWNEHIHAFGDWKITTDATCAEPGEQTRVCACGEVQTQAIPATGAHSSGKWQTVRDATCLVNGERIRVCECGATLEKQTITVLEHRYDGEIQWKTDDLAQQLCSICNTFADLTPSTALSFTFHDDTKSYYLSDASAHKPAVLLIPATYRGYPVKGIEANAFRHCYAETVLIPASITNIPRRLFAENNEISCISISPANEVYHSAGNCIINTATKTVIAGCSGSILPDGGSVTTIGESAFAYLSISHLHIPKEITQIDENAFDCCTMDEITVSDGNPNYHSKDNCLIETATKTLVAGSRESVIPADGSVTVIGEGAFSQRRIGKISLPDTITEIRSSAFFNCPNLTSITIPTSVTKIATNAIYGCRNLREITVADGNPVYHSGGGNCIIETASKTLIIGNHATVIPTDGSVERIKTFAFYSDSTLKEITIPQSVTRIDSDAFSYCTYLKDITYLGTKAQWEQITKPTNWITSSFSVPTSYTVHCTDGDITVTQ